MSENAKAAGVNRAKLYQLVLFPLNNGATNVYYVLVLSTLLPLAAMYWRWVRCLLRSWLRPCACAMPLLTPSSAH